MSLPIFLSPSREMGLMQTGWASILNPIIENPLSSGILLKSVSLISGVTVVNHLLGRMLQGWIITDRNGTATVYRSQPKNALTLTLTSSAALVVDLYVF